MTKLSKCHHASPRLLDRLVMWFGGTLVLHNWGLYQKQNGNIIYYCRKCECGANEVQNAGPMGNGKWQEISEPFGCSWEKDSFNKAKLLDT